MNILSAWAQAFLATLLIELSVAVPLLSGVARAPRRALAVCFGQVLTHPAVWFIFPIFGWSRLNYLLVAESWAILGELVFYRFVFQNLSWSRALAASAIANVASYAIGSWLGV